MINVTDNAVRQLRSLLLQENSQKGLRVEVAKGGCSGLHYEMTLGHQEEGDAIVERDGVQFFIDDESVSYLRGATLDFTDGLTGTGFRIVNPNASRKCGCGKSSKHRSRLETGYCRAELMDYGTQSYTRTTSPTRVHRSGSIISRGRLRFCF